MVERTLISFASQLQLIERLQHLLYLSSSMIFISGEQGSGKSTLVEQLSNQLPNSTQQAFITLSEPTSVVQMRELIISQLFEQPLFDADDTLVNILQLLTENQDPNIARVIVIDNAKLLPKPLLKELADVIKQKSSISNNEINFVLLSEESSTKQMVSLINSVQNNQDVATLTFRLAPLNAQEANQLINHRFDQIGYSPEIQHKDALAKQLSYCGGIPEKILSLASELSSGDLAFDKPSWLKTRFPAILLMLLLVTIATGLATYLYPQLIKNKVEVETIVESQDVLFEEIVGAELVIDDLSKASPTETLAGQWSTDDDQLVNDTQLNVGEADNEERVTISEQQLLELGYYGEESRAVSSEATALLVKEADKKIDSETESKIGSADTSEQVLAISEPMEEFAKINAPIIKTLPAVTVEPIASPDAPNAPVVPSIIETEPAVLPVKEFTFAEIDELDALEKPPTDQPQPEIEMLESVTAVLPIEAKYRDIFTPTNTLLAISKNKFTLQLSGMGSTKTLKEFIIEYQLPRENVYLYKTLRDRKPWYVVIYGQFESRKMANRAANNLPNTLGKLDSWVKEYSLVHQDLLINE